MKFKDQRNGEALRARLELGLQRRSQLRTEYALALLQSSNRDGGWNALTADGAQTFLDSADLLAQADLAMCVRDTQKLQEEINAAAKKADEARPRIVTPS